MNYGSKQAAYKLDYIAEVELNLKKVEYRDITLDEFFIREPIESTLYNIVDVLLIVGLGNKLQFFGLHNTIRRAMRCTYHDSMIGSSAVYDSFVFSKLDEIGERIRYGIVTESNISFSKEELASFGQMKGATKKAVDAPQISSRQFSSISKKFPGAYVKLPLPEIINDGSATIDMDATSMYPSNILQGNLSFDCYVARIIPPQAYNIIHNVLIPCLGTGKYPPGLQQAILDNVSSYIDREDVKPKDQNKALYYFIILGCLQRLLNSGRTFQEIIEPKDNESSLLLRTLLIPLLDIIFNINKDNKEGHNTWVFDYLYYRNDNVQKSNLSAMNKLYPHGVWVIYNPNESNTYIKNLTNEEIYDYILQESLALSGCMFKKHSVKKGLFVDMLIDFGDLRKHHKKLRDTYVRGTKEYKFEDNNQNVFKRLMNTCYGLYGMAAFRYSDNWLSRSITNNSKHALKCTIAIAERYLKDHNL